MFVQVPQEAVATSAPGEDKLPVGCIAADRCTCTCSCLSRNKHRYLIMITGPCTHIRLAPFTCWR